MLLGRSGVALTGDIARRLDTFFVWSVEAPQNFRSLGGGGELLLSVWTFRSGEQLETRL